MGDLLRITELDGAGVVTATYVQTPGGTQGISRVDMIPPKALKSPWQRLLDVFLPVGYPHSVTKDYLEYQIYDSLQAFSSSIASLLSSRAVLSSVGVGDSTASPTAALLLSILQDSAGRIATILFAYRLGTALEPECKMYRLLADVLNDIAFILDCLSPIFPKPLRVLILSFSSVLRALCGVAAGSAKASLSAHFARWGNLGELNAKDSSQETVISLLGMLVGSVVVSWVTSPLATWTALVLLLSIHLETNRRAVRAVSMRTLNRQRATLVFHHLQRGHVPSPDEVSAQERIFDYDGVLRTSNDQVLGYCAVGAPVSRFLEAMAEERMSAHALRLDSTAFEKVLRQYQSRAYFVWYDKKPLIGNLHFNIVLKTGATAKDVLVAWWDVLGIACETERFEALGEKTGLRLLEPAAQLLGKYEGALREKGWDLESGALETMAATRVAIHD